MPKQITNPYRRCLLVRPHPSLIWNPSSDLLEEPKNPRASSITNDQGLMSRALRGETVRVIAQSLGMDDIPEMLVEKICSQVDMTTRQLVHDAITISRHCKRPFVSADDLNVALGLRDEEVRVGVILGRGDERRARLTSAPRPVNCARAARIRISLAYGAPA